ncbi:MAG TPA: zf-TFIIB domain-containing protein, partial [Candidatus Udaeobacter sp.]|nr:zf-TFIIB domain-containing protein [Candidatus Udaeobacter sp.]
VRARLRRLDREQGRGKNEKDRFGEKVAFDERANEDTYFAVKEHELIEEMKTDFQKREAAKREGQIVNCPKCPGKLEHYEFMGFVLDRCASCEGVWLDKGKLDGIVRRAARGPLGAFLDRCFAKDETKKME